LLRVEEVGPGEFVERGHSGPEGSDELKGSWWQGWRIDIDGYVEWWGWRGERGRERESGIHFVGGGVADGGMGSGIVCIAYALGVEGPLQILGGVQESHAAIPVPPPAFQFTVAARVMTKRGFRVVLRAMWIAVIRWERNSGAASLWRMSGAPRRK